MSNRTVTFRSAIIVTLGSAAICACDGLAAPDDASADLAIAGIALADADLPSGSDASWHIDVELEAVPHVRITVPAGIAALERREDAERDEDVRMMKPGLLAGTALATRIIPPSGDGLELSLFDRRTGELVGKTKVKGERKALFVELDDPCRSRPRCALRLRIHARWLGGAAVRVSPDVEIESALGRIRLVGE